MKQAYISLIDSSASMWHNWTRLSKNFNEYVPKENAKTICFDNRVHPCHNNTLSQYIEEHGEGTTNIISGFQALDKAIAEIDQDTHITVLFISDGEDDHPETLQERLKTLKGN